MAGDPGSVADVLAGATAGNASRNKGLSEEIAQLAEQLQQLQAASQASVASLLASGQASSRVTAGGSASGGSLGSTLLDVFGGGLGLSPLITGIASLFSGSGDSSALAPLAKFALPPSIQANGGVNESGGQAFAVDNPQGGLPRAAPATGQASTPAQITVQVQAMDSQSFLDHSGDIAMAVRQAMLESSVLNDVVREA
jgi:hypothetical protein